MALPDRPIVNDWSQVEQLRDILERLSALAEEAFPRIPGGIRETDLYAHMGLTFLCKQIEHAKSLLALGRSRDGVLIARSMIEGMVQLLWASRLPGLRARRWWDFEHIHRWRMMRRYREAGISVEPDVYDGASRSARTMGWRFLTSKAEKARLSSRPLPTSPYVPNWTGMDIKTLCRETGYEEKYVTFYADFSDWHHWGTTGVSEPLSAGGVSEVAYQCHDPAVTAQALANGVQCLGVTLHLVDDHLCVGMRGELQELVDEYTAFTVGRQRAVGRAVSSSRLTSECS